MWLLLGGLNLEHQAHHLPAQTEDGKSSQAEPESQADWATSSVPVTAPKPTPEPEPSPWEGAEPESRTSGVSTRNSSRPQYNKRVGGSCLIHVYLENERTTKYKSILVTCQDRVPVIIRRALDAHLLQQEDPENFELLQIVSNHQSKWNNQRVGSSESQWAQDNWEPKHSVRWPNAQEEYGGTCARNKV
ncbi:ral guanine nucleotide dissociation stimulator-like [Marmota marmota marmota]|uniref:ral guanine nucleotide dissociation stimulator-like n=1 Tax=Marmota marmota marmota TaxID=9994 RepID=UPI0007625131|nr:ral guanine nucleotide dissociation stimulator-like [Marmota marmota marmota]